MKYTLKIYEANKHGKVESIEHIEFTITPEFKVTSYCAVDPIQNNKTYNSPLTQQKSDAIIATLKEWLFKKRTAPIDDAYAWSISPAFTEADKKRIQKMYLFEEL